MGDRGHNRHGPKRGGLLCPFPGVTGSLGRGLLPYQVASSSIQPFGHNRHEPKTGGCAPFRGLRSHLAQRRLGGGLPPYQVASWSIQPFGHNRHGPKIGWGLCPFSGGAGSSSNTKSHGSRPMLLCMLLHYLGKRKNQKFAILVHVKHVSNMTFYHLPNR